jgi:hypothetical protein
MRAFQVTSFDIAAPVDAPATPPEGEVLLGIKLADSTADLLMANGTYQDTHHPSPWEWVAARFWRLV